VIKPKTKEVKTSRYNEMAGWARLEAIVLAGIVLLAAYIVLVLLMGILAALFGR
jgi:hypothetical protein